MVWCGMGWCGVSRVMCRCGNVWCGVGWCGVGWCGVGRVMCRCGNVWCGVGKQGGWVGETWGTKEDYGGQCAHKHFLPCCRCEVGSI